MNYLLLILPNTSIKPELPKGILSTTAQKGVLWNYWKTRAFRLSVQEIVQCWPISEEYLDAISIVQPTYIKGGIQYSVVCLDRDRILLTNTQLSAEKTAILLAEVPLVTALTTDPVGWLATNGYTVV